MQNRFTLIAGILTLITAVLGVLTGLEMVPWQAVAVSGVLAGLWWAFGRSILPEEFAADREAHRARREA
ncbi:hypothetical protein ACQP1U_15440 [Actinomycetota bacterium]